MMKMSKTYYLTKQTKIQTMLDSTFYKGTIKGKDCFSEEY